MGILRHADAGNIQIRGGVNEIEIMNSLLAKESRQGFCGRAKGKYADPAKRAQREHITIR
eukprot:1213232-Pyramimonas_sp.AAC.1